MGGMLFLSCMNKPPKRSAALWIWDFAGEYRSQYVYSVFIGGLLFRAGTLDADTFLQVILFSVGLIASLITVMS